MDTSASGTVASFNGATAVRPWMDDCFHYPRTIANVLQWGHGREAMDGASARSARLGNA